MAEQLELRWPIAKQRRVRTPRAQKPTAFTQRICVGFSLRAGFCDRGAGHEGPHGSGETTWRVSKRGVVVHGDERELCAAKLMQPNGFAWLGEERLCSREVGHDGDHENDCGDAWAEGTTIAPCASCFGATTETDGITPCAACEGTGRANEEPATKPNAIPGRGAEVEAWCAERHATMHLYLAGTHGTHRPVCGRALKPSSRPPERMNTIAVDVLTASSTCSSCRRIASAYGLVAVPWAPGPRP